MCFSTGTLPLEEEGNQIAVCEKGKVCQKELQSAKYLGCMFLCPKEYIFQRGSVFGDEGKGGHSRLSHLNVTAASCRVETHAGIDKNQSLFYKAHTEAK